LKVGAPAAAWWYANIGENIHPARYVVHEYTEYPGAARDCYLPGTAI